MPWQATVVLISVGIVAVVVISLIAIFKNKNVSTNGEIRGQRFGLSITDGAEPSKPKSESKKESDNTTIFLMRLSSLKVHPLISTTIINIVYKNSLSDKIIKKAMKMIDTDETKSENINMILDISSQLFRRYIATFKGYVENILSSAEDDIITNDRKYTKTSLVVRNFVDDIESNFNVRLTVETMQTTGVPVSEHCVKGIKPEMIPNNVYTIFSSSVKIETLDLYRELRIAMSSMFSINSNDFERNTLFINGIERLFDAVDKYVFCLYTEIRYVFMLELLDYLVESGVNDVEYMEPVEEPENESHN